MHPTATLRNVLVASLLSLALTFTLAVVYALHPILAAVWASLSSPRDGSGGIGAVAGGLGASFIWATLLLEPALFLIIFFLLQRRTARNLSPKRGGEV